jgi:hypothetical protein
MVAHFTVGNMVFSSIYYGISLQFRLLSAAIQDIDDICVDLKEDLTQEDDKYSEGTKPNSHDSDREACQRGALDRVTKTLLSTDTFSVKFLDRGTSVGAYTGDVEDSEDLYAAPKNRTSRNETAYMIECIKYHQCLLK